MQQTPSVGRIVHFHPSVGAPPEAAIVIAVHSNQCVNLSTCNANGTWTSRTSVSFGVDAASPSYWAWPPRA